MAYHVVMPKAGMAMETGRIIKWLKEQGERVEAGEPLLEIETDKTAMEVEAPVAGVLIKILAEEGDEIPVVQTIAYIGDEGETVTEAGQDAPAQSIRDTSAQPEPPVQAAPPGGAKIAATPAARRIARETGVPLGGVSPSGSFGQIKAADVRASARQAGTAEPPAGDEWAPYSGMRKAIARRMLQSHLEIPPVTQSSVADVTELAALRERINAGTGGVRISFNDLIVMAAARALKEHPYINVSYAPEGLIFKKRINIGIAVAKGDGLIVPVIRDADTLSATQIARAARALAAKAREGRLAPDEYAGGTFTVSNLGMMGVTAFTPIINQPESAILGVCAVEQRLEMDESGAIQKRLKMNLCLTYDHRSIDGAQAALFTNAIISQLQNPLTLLV